MGRLTMVDVVSRGIIKAGNANLASVGLEWLQSWLTAQYEAWTWPFLRRNVTFVLPANTATLEVGAENGGLEDRFRHFLSPLRIWPTSNKSQLRILGLSEPGTSPTYLDPLIQGPSVKGFPSWMAAAPYGVAGDGSWMFEWAPYTDQEYSVVARAYVVPKDIADANIEYPLYPNDETMIALVEAQALNHMKQYDIAGAKMQEVGERVKQDRMKYAAETGINDNMGLDLKMYPGARVGTNGGQSAGNWWNKPFSTES